jgi:hypothetical protein
MGKKKVAGDLPTTFNREETPDKTAGILSTALRTVTIPVKGNDHILPGGHGAPPALGSKREISLGESFHYLIRFLKNFF